MTYSILFILNSNINQSTSANIRNRELIKGLTDNGYEVDLLMVANDDSNEFPVVRCIYLYSNTIYKITKQQYSGNKLLKKAKILLSKIYNNFEIYDHRKFNKKYINSEIYENEYDFVISSSDPKSTHLIAEEFISKYKKNIKWIQYWGDPFYNDINIRNRNLKFKTKIEEKRLLNLADKIVYVSPLTLEIQKKLYPESDFKMEYLPTPSSIKLLDIDRDFNFQIGYFGDFYSKDRSIIHLLESIEVNKFKTIIRGGTDEKTLKLINNIKCIDYSERVSHNEVVSLEEKTELLICIANKKGTQIPGKVFYYATTNKPILFILDGEYSEELRKIFGETNRYYLCRNNEKEISDKIKEILLESKIKSYLPYRIFQPQQIAKNFIVGEKK